MIKVNLLKDQTARIRKTVMKPAVSRMMLLYVAIFLLVAGGMGGWWYYVNHQVKVLTSSRDRLRIEYARLEQLKKEVDRYEKLKQLRQSRIDVIERLKENQKLEGREAVKLEGQKLRNGEVEKGASSMPVDSS